LKLDLGDLDSVKQAVKTFSEQESKLDVLWNNAGIGAKAFAQGQRTAQGFEPLMGIHCIGTLLLSELMVPYLRRASAEGDEPGATRVVWAGSIMAETNSAANGGIPWDRLHDDHNEVEAYGSSKLGSWYLSREFARRHEADGITSVSMNPGNLKTTIFDGVPPVAMFLFNCILHPPKFGGYTELFAGLSPEIRRENSGCSIIPWGRIRDESDIPREDLRKAVLPVDEGGMGYDTRFYEWCQEQYSPYV
jgi:NAD(P)-dependent dehydrogenase (short-subunit alcohol dehydrogenase family)